MSGSTAFNEVSRSSLLLALHPEDMDRRVLVRGKGNLCPEPSAFEFYLKEVKLETPNGDVVKPVAVDTSSIATTDLTKDDLIGDDKTLESMSKIDEAKALLPKLLPNDGQWHEAKPLLTQAKDEYMLDRRLMWRAAKVVGIMHRREESFQPKVLWKWPLTVSVKRSGKR
jgi:hypothetical protein